MSHYDSQFSPVDEFLMEEAEREGLEVTYDEETDKFTVTDPREADTAETEDEDASQRNRPFAADVRAAGPNTVQGTCTCSWVGPERDVVVTADRDIRRHLQEDHYL